MRNFKNSNLVLFYLVMGLMFQSSVFGTTDNYPKNPKIDAINYVFNIELFDYTDEITCEVTVDIRYLGKGVEKLRLDLVNAYSWLSLNYKCLVSCI